MPNPPTLVFDIGRDKTFSQTTFAGLAYAERIVSGLEDTSSVNVEITVRLHTTDQPKQFYKEIYHSIDHIVEKQLDDCNVLNLSVRCLEGQFHNGDWTSNGNIECTDAYAFELIIDLYSPKLKFEGIDETTVKRFARVMFDDDCVWWDALARRGSGDNLTFEEKLDRRIPVFRWEDCDPIFQKIVLTIEKTEDHGWCEECRPHCLEGNTLRREED